MANKKYRFFYHFRKSDKKMSVHFKNQCIPCNNIVCEVPCETKWNKTQPLLVMRGFCSEVSIDDNEVCHIK